MFHLERLIRENKSVEWEHLVTQWVEPRVNSPFFGLWLLGNLGVTWPQHKTRMFLLENFVGFEV